MLLCPCDFPGKSIGVGCHYLSQSIFPTQGLNPGLLHCKQDALLSEPPGKSHRKETGKLVYYSHLFKNFSQFVGKGRGTRNQISNIYWIIEKAREFQKNIYFYFIDYAKAFDCVYHNKLWKILKEMEIPDHLTCLLRNLLYAGQEATV